MKPETPFKEPTTRSEDLLALVQLSLPDLSPEEHEAIYSTSMSAMVEKLGKSGASIAGSMTLANFTSLGVVIQAVVEAGNLLDSVKKQVIYGKAGPEEPSLLLPLNMAGSLIDMTAEKAHLLHMAIGAAGEASELLRAVAEHVFNGAELDRENLVEEVGDATFYQVGILNPLNVTTAEMALRNRIKLMGKRFRKGYSDQAAQERADKPAGQ